MKTVELFGKTYEVENRFKYVAVDSNGGVWAYVNRPVLKWGNAFYSQDVFGGNGKTYKKLGVIIKPGEINFEPTLIEVK